MLCSPLHVPLSAVAALLLGSGCGGAGATARHSPAAASDTSSRPAPIALRLSGTTRLPAAVQLPAVAPAARGVVVLGGLSASDTSVANTLFIGPSGAREGKPLPVAVHDAAAANVDGHVYLFGGGTGSSASKVILRVARGSSSVAGQLPVGASDVAAATIGHTAYIVGGYTETIPLATIVAFTPGSATHVVGLLPRPLRYAAVAAVGGRLLIAGGTSGVTAQRAILSYDPATRAVRGIGELPYPVTHAAGASLNGYFYVLGGRSASLTGQRASILAVDPSTGNARSAGRLPEALSDLGSASFSGRILLVGGRDSSGIVHDQALTLVPSR